MRGGVRSTFGDFLDWAGGNPFKFTSLILMSGVLVSAAINILFPNFSAGYFEGIFVEFTGMLFDIAVFGLLIAFVSGRQTVKEELKRQQEIIDDFKSWGSEEAKFRIAGAIRRINNLGSTEIDFRGATLRDFVFSNHGVNDLSGSRFADDFSLRELHRVGARLEGVGFSFVVARGCVFSNAAGGVIGNLRGKNLKFWSSDLEGALFEGAILKWDTIIHREDDWVEEVGTDEEGNPLFNHVYIPAFESANLRGVSFKGAWLENADFRGAKNVAEANFVEAKGLATCRFDEGVVEEIEKQLKRAVRDQQPPALTD